MVSHLRAEHDLPKEARDGLHVLGHGPVKGLDEALQAPQTHLSARHVARQQAARQERQQLAQAPRLRREVLTARTNAGKCCTAGSNAQPLILAHEQSR